jgi:hypothetical protein
MNTTKKELEMTLVLVSTQEFSVTIKHIQVSLVIRDLTLRVFAITRFKKNENKNCIIARAAELEQLIILYS